MVFVSAPLLGEGGTLDTTRTEANAARRIIMLILHFAVSAVLNVFDSDHKPEDNRGNTACVVLPFTKDFQAMTLM
jgi:hypothetical protein